MRPKAGISRRAAFLLVTAIITFSVMAATTYTVWRLRLESLDRHVEAATMQARALEDHLTQTFNVIDLTLANAGGEAPEPAALSAALNHAPYLRSLALLDTHGLIVASSDRQNLGSRVSRGDFLPPTLEHRAILRAGTPWEGRDFHDGRPATEAHPVAADTQSLIPVLRDVMSDGGAWVTLLASVNTDYFLNFYGRSLAADAGAVELLRYDGLLLLSSDPRRKPGTRGAGEALSGHIATGELGHFEQTLEDGRVVITAYRSSRAYPFVIAVHLDKENALAEWRKEAGRTLALVSAALLVALALAWLYFARNERVARQHEAAVARLRLLGTALETAANSIIITDREGRIEWANPAFATLSGYTMDEILGRNPRELIKSGQQPAGAYRELWQTILAGRVWRGEMTNRRKDGSLYLEDQTVTPVLGEEGAISHFVSVKQDITERRQSEKRMEELSRHLVVVQESARRRLSGELHDRTSPNLAAIGVNLDIITAAMAQSSSPVLAERIEDVRALIEDTTASIREICSDLRPPVLDYAGLSAALESYVKQFQRRTGIEVRFDAAQHAARLPPELESVLFRVVQEALANCAKHARATLITIDLHLDASSASLAIRDDGIGFDAESKQETTHAGGLGILTMREMVEFSGGSFVLESLSGNGTRITVEIPLAEGPT